MPSFLPQRERCAGECGKRRAPGKQVCWDCYRRAGGVRGPSGPMEKPDRSGEEKPTDGKSRPSQVGASRPQMAPAGTSPEPFPEEASEEEQYRELEELSRCISCGVSWGGHTIECKDYLQFLDLTEEYDPGDYAEQI